MSSSIEQPVQGEGINLLSWVGSKQALQPTAQAAPGSPAPGSPAAPEAPAAPAVAPAAPAAIESPAATGSPAVPAAPEAPAAAPAVAPAAPAAIESPAATGSPAVPAAPAAPAAIESPAIESPAPPDMSKISAIELFDLSTKELTDANTQIDVMIKEEQTATTDKTKQSIDSINNSIMYGIAYLKAGIDKRNFT